MTLWTLRDGKRYKKETDWKEVEFHSGRTFEDTFYEQTDGGKNRFRSNRGEGG